MGRLHITLSSRDGIVFITAFILWLLQGCASNTAIPVADGFWQDKSPVVAVAVTAVPDPEVRLKTMYSSGMRLPRILLGPDDGDRDNEERIMVEADQLELQRSLNKSCNPDLSAARALFVQQLLAKGFSAVSFLDNIDLQKLPDYTPHSKEYAYKDYRRVFKAGGPDLLIVLQTRWSGVCCHYSGRINDLTETVVNLRGEMVDMATNRILWRSSDRQATVRKAVKCSCERPADPSCIVDELDSLFGEAAHMLVNDFFENAPQG